MRRILLNLSLIAVLATLIGSCGDKKGAQPPVPDMPVVEAVQKDVPLNKEFVGEIYGISDIPIRARVEGWLEGMSFTEGSMVKKDQVLYRIDPEPLQAKVNAANSQLAEAQTMLAKAQNDYNRYKPLAEINAVSQSDLDWAKAQYEAAQATVEAARAELDLAKINLSYSVIKAPITGIIGKTLARVGEFVGRQPNAIILNTVSRVDTVRVEFYLTEANYLEIARRYLASRNGNKADTSDSKDYKMLKLVLADGTEFVHMGKVDFIDREVNEKSGSFLVQASFPNPDHLLRPGQFARVVVPMEMAKGAVLIPQRCIQEIQGLHQVYVVGDDGTVEARRVEVGPTYQNYWLITSGLNPGEKVILEGLQKVKSGIKVNPVIQDLSGKEQAAK